MLFVDRMVGPLLWVTPPPPPPSHIQDFQADNAPFSSSRVGNSQAHCNQSHCKHETKHELNTEVQKTMVDHSACSQRVMDGREIDNLLDQCCFRNERSVERRNVRRRSCWRSGADPVRTWSVTTLWWDNGRIHSALSYLKTRSLVIEVIHKYWSQKDEVYCYDSTGKNIDNHFRFTDNHYYRKWLSVILLILVLSIISLEVSRIFLNFRK